MTMDEVRQTTIDLYQFGSCTPACMFGTEDPCQCRCDGRWHGLIYENNLPPLVHKVVAGTRAEDLTPLSVDNLQVLINQHPGDLPLFLVLIDDDDRKTLKLRQTVDGCDVFHRGLTDWMSR